MGHILPENLDALSRSASSTTSSIRVYLGEDELADGLRNEAHAADIARISAADTVIELGSGTCDKTRVLLRALGGTIGNLRSPERAAMLAELSDNMMPGDAQLLGTDLVKDRGRLVRAYDDEAGVTAAFNLNVLRRLNRELGADFDLSRFTHVARFNESEEWIEMRLQSMGAQRVTIADLGLSLTFDDGEELLTEISAKFRPDKVRREIEAAGLDLAARWADDANDFGLSLSTKGTMT